MQDTFCRVFFQKLPWLRFTWNVLWAPSVVNQTCRLAIIAPCMSYQACDAVWKDYPYSWVSGLKKRKERDRRTYERLTDIWLWVCLPFLCLGFRLRWPFDLDGPYLYSFFNFYRYLFFLPMHVICFSKTDIRNREAIESHLWTFLFQLCFIRHLLTLCACYL